MQLVDFDSDEAYVARLTTAGGFGYIGRHVGMLIAMSTLCCGVGLLISMAVGIGVKWILIGRRHEGSYDWDQRCVPRAATQLVSRVLAARTVPLPAPRGRAIARALSCGLAAPT